MQTSTCSHISTAERQRNIIEKDHLVRYTLQFRYMCVNMQKINKKDTSAHYSITTSYFFFYEWVTKSLILSTDSIKNIDSSRNITSNCLRVTESFTQRICSKTMIHSWPSIWVDHRIIHANDSFNNSDSFRNETFCFWCYISGSQTCPGDPQPQHILYVSLI